MNLPPYDPDDPASLQFILDFIATRLLDTGGRSLKLRAGSDSVTYPGGSALSNGKNVSHGLGSTPIAVALVANSAGVGASYAFVTGALTSTVIPMQITAPGFTPALNTTQTFYWLAIG